MIDVNQLKQDGYDLQRVEYLCDRLLEVLYEESIPEATMLSVSIENLMSDCSDHKKIQD